MVGTMVIVAKNITNQLIHSKPNNSNSNIALSRGTVGETTGTPIVPAERPTGGYTHLGSQEEAERSPATRYISEGSPTGGYTHLGSQNKYHSLPEKLQGGYTPRSSQLNNRVNKTKTDFEIDISNHNKIKNIRDSYYINNDSNNSIKRLDKDIKYFRYSKDSISNIKNGNQGHPSNTHTYTYPDTHTDPYTHSYTY